MLTTRLNSNLRHLRFLFTPFNVVPDIFMYCHSSYAPINVMPEGGGVGGRDEVGTLNVRANLTWAILANFEHTCWPQEWEA